MIGLRTDACNPRNRSENAQRGEKWPYCQPKRFR